MRTSFWVITLFCHVLILNAVAAKAESDIDCIEDLIDIGVSPDVAATQCFNKRRSSDDGRSPGTGNPQWLPQLIMPFFSVPSGGGPNPYGRRPSQYRVIQPTSRAGNWFVYTKPGNVSDSVMNAAGATFYPSHVACSMHWSLCTSLNGVWLSQNSVLEIQ